MAAKRRGGTYACAFSPNNESGAQDILFYMYAPDVAAYRAELEVKGVKVGPIKYPFYSPRGEFRIDDPDGYTLFVSHAD
jgi:hypothetical protein